MLYRTHFNAKKPATSLCKLLADKSLWRAQQGSNLWPLAPEAIIQDSPDPVNIDDSGTAQNFVTQNVTRNTENVTLSDLLEALRGLPKEDIVRLLTEALKQ